MLRQQQELLSKAKSNFPNHSLKTWSEKTGIQMTRIFRLFRGKEMMLSEYLAFENYLAQYQETSEIQSLNTFLKQSQLCLKHLPLSLIDQLNLSLQFHLENYFVFNGDSIPTTKE